MTKEASYMGIDPGGNGAVAILMDGMLPWVHDCPSDEIGMAKLVRETIISCDFKLCALELVHSMPKQGVASTFKFGVNFGIWKGILASFSIPFILVSPQQWQKGVVPKKTDGVNKPSLSVARRMFPDAELHLKKHDGRADALLLADYARRMKG